jgi:archaellum component FlaC
MDEGRLQEHLDRRFDSLDNKFERVEAKLDNHLDRLSRAEASIEWLRGHSKIVTIIVLSVAGYLATMFINTLN